MTAGEPERWLCRACGTNGVGRGDWDGTRLCPRCGKRKVETNRCSMGLLCFVVGLPGSGRHATVDEARRCERRWGQA